jgi:predicted enzyme related to lactoylglutathione lyase
MGRARAPRLLPPPARDAARAVDFYVAALSATETARYMGRRKDAIAHVDLVVGGEPFSITEEARAWNSDAPVSLGGSPVVLQLQVQDVEALFERMCRAGAEVVFLCSSSVATLAGGAAPEQEATRATAAAADWPVGR